MTAGFDASASLDAIGWVCFSTELYLLAGFGWMSDGAEKTVLSYTLPAIQTEFNVTDAQLGGFSSLLSATQALGALFWGSRADAVGRRPAFLGSVGLTALCGVCSAWAVSSGLPAYLSLRALTGFAIGGNLPLAATLMSEMLPPRHRDRCILGLHLFNECGALSSTGLAMALLPHSCASGTRCEWAIYLALVAVPSAIVSPIAACRLPESASWLASKGRHDEARTALARVKGGGRSAAARRLREGDALPFDLPVSSSATEPPVNDAASAQREDGAADGSLPTTNDGLVDGEAREPSRTTRCDGDCCSSSSNCLPAAASSLFSRSMLRTTLCITLLWFTADAASGWWTWLPTLATSQHVPSTIMYTASLVGRVIASVSFLVAALSISCVRPYTLLLCSLILTCVGSCLLTLWAATPLFSSPSFVAVYGGFALVFGGAWSLLYVVTPACFPPDLRATGFGLAHAGSKLGSLVSPLVVGGLIEGGSVLAVGAFLTAGWAVATVCLVAVPRSR